MLEPGWASSSRSPRPEVGEGTEPHRDGPELGDTGGRKALASTCRAHGSRPRWCRPRCGSVQLRRSRSPRHRVSRSSAILTFGWAISISLPPWAVAGSRYRWTPPGRLRIGCVSRRVVLERPPPGAPSIALVRDRRSYPREISSSWMRRPRGDGRRPGPRMRRRAARPDERPGELPGCPVLCPVRSAVVRPPGALPAPSRRARPARPARGVPDPPGRRARLIPPSRPLGAVGVCDPPALARRPRLRPPPRPPIRRDPCRPTPPRR